MSRRRNRQEVVSEGRDGEGRAEPRLIPVSAWTASMKPLASLSPSPRPELPPLRPQRLCGQVHTQSRPASFTL